MSELLESGIARISTEIYHGHRAFVWKDFLFDRIPWHVLYANTLFPDEVLVASDPRLDHIDFDDDRVSVLEEWLRQDLERTQH